MYYTVPNRVYSTLYGCYKLVFKSLFDTGVNNNDIKKAATTFSCGFYYIRYVFKLVEDPHHLLMVNWRSPLDRHLHDEQLAFPLK